MSGFAITRGRGFHITFDNGYTVSVQFGPTHYCANRTDSSAFLEADREALGAGFVTIECEDAEIAAWDAQGKWYRPEGWDDDVHGWQPPAQALAFMQEVAAL